MRINEDKTTYKPPFTVILLDAMDAYYYADVMDKMEEVAKEEDLDKAIALADALFVEKNKGWESLQTMNDVDGGYDVRVYDSEFSCVYAAHTKYIENWIDKPLAPGVFTSKMQKAIRFSIKTHEVYQKQKRKGKDIPYITHPLTVGLILARAVASEDVVIAGILHDTIEDSTPEKKVTSEMITERFGGKVAELVLSVTETDKELSWEERKAEALEHIKAFSNDSLLLKSADIIANTSELIEDYSKDGEEIFARFNAPKERLLEQSVRTIRAICDKWPESPLVADLMALEAQLKELQSKQRPQND
jgi:hypothetical protein